jgi:hypothetical protein
MSDADVVCCHSLDVFTDTLPCALPYKFLSIIRSNIEIELVGGPFLPLTCREGLGASRRVKSPDRPGFVAHAELVVACWKYPPKLI